MNVAVRPMAVNATACITSGILYKTSFRTEHILNTDDPTMTHTMKTAKIKPRYRDVDSFMVLPDASAAASSALFNAGVHMNTNVYMAPSKHD